MRSIAVLLVLLVSFAVQAQYTHIVAYAEYKLNPIPGKKMKTVDSESYIYNTYRPGIKVPPIEHIISLENIHYDTDFFFGSVNDTQWSTSCYQKHTHTFDANDNVASLRIFNWVAATSSWDTTSEYLYTWTPGKDTASVVYRYKSGTSLQFISRATYDHNVMNNRTSELYEYWNNTLSAWEYGRRNIMLYDSSGINRLLDSTEIYNTTTLTWNPANKTVCTYSGKNIVTRKYYVYSSGVWVFSMSYDSTAYNTNNLITSFDKLNIISGVPTPNVRSLYTYNTDNTLQYTDHYETYPHPSLTFISRSHFNYVNGNLVLEYETDIAGDTTAMNYYYYDVYNNVNRYEHATRSGGKWVVQNRYLYYYEPVFKTGINTTNTFDGKLQVYPVPAAGVLNVNVTFNQPQSFTATICDMHGRVVKQWNEQATVEYSRSILTNELAPGSYMLNINGKQKTSKVFIVQ